MTTCEHCSSDKLIGISGKTSDLNVVFDLRTEQDYDGYMPNVKGLGAGDYINFTVCFECSRLQNLDKSRYRYLIDLIENPNLKYAEEEE